MDLPASLLREVYWAASQQDAGYGRLQPRGYWDVYDHHLWDKSRLWCFPVGAEPALDDVSTPAESPLMRNKLLINLVDKTHISEWQRVTRSVYKLSKHEAKTCENKLL